MTYCKSCEANTEHQATGLVIDGKTGQRHRYYKCLACGRSMVRTEEISPRGLKITREVPK